MRGCQEQTCEGDLGGSSEHGWTGRTKTDNILLMRWGVTLKQFGPRIEIVSCSHVRSFMNKQNFTGRSKQSRQENCNKLPVVL
jgi:hypothetical protein